MKDDTVMVDLDTGEITVRVPMLRTRYNYDMARVSEETGLKCFEATRTQQQFKDECDINTIVRKFGVTGELPSNVRIPLEGDFADVSNYQEALNKLIEAEEEFMKLPSEVRKRFDNDPGKMVEFVSVAENRDEARKLGLLVPEAVKAEPVFVRVVKEEGGEDPTKK